VGLDVIGDSLTEINVTSPTCFQEITEQTGFDVAGVHRRAGGGAGCAALVLAGLGHRAGGRRREAPAAGATAALAGDRAARAGIDDDHVIKLVDSCREEEAAYGGSHHGNAGQQAASRAVTPA
jgi:hypothetical protein